MEKVCPCCGTTFECNNDDILNCHCISIGLNSRQRYCLGLLYRGCLCHECLRRISEMSETELDLFVSENQIK